MGRKKQEDKVQFRGWIKIDKKDVDWRDWFGYGMIYEFNYIGTPFDKSHECQDTKGNEFLCNDIEWMRYTGWKDKNAKKIYEGDIISKQGAYVVYDDDLASFCFQFKDSKTPPVPLFHIKERDKVEIIGNIYENPELLK